MTIKAIETEYKGYRFRSRLEARWAVFFDACGFKWDYEPEGFDINGIKYLPDFCLHDVCFPLFDDDTAPHHDFYIEVKGEMDGFDREKIEAFAREWPVYVVGNIPFAKDFFDYMYKIAEANMEDRLYYTYATIYGNEYPAGIFVNKDGRPDFAGADEETENLDIEKTLSALRAARAARFEHGEGL